MPRTFERASTGERGQLRRFIGRWPPKTAASWRMLQLACLFIPWANQRSSRGGGHSVIHFYSWLPKRVLDIFFGAVGWQGWRTANSSGIMGNISFLVAKCRIACSSIRRGRACLGSASSLNKSWPEKWQMANDKLLNRLRHSVPWLGVAQVSPEVFGPSEECFMKCNIFRQ